VGVFVALAFSFAGCSGDGDSKAPASVKSQEKVVPARPKLSRDEVVAARKQYNVKVLSFDATQEIGAEFPYSDFVRLKVTNNSRTALPFLTLLTKRYDAKGKMIGSSRAPSITVGDLKPGESAEVDYYPKGHLPGVRRMTVEVERLIPQDAVQFFKEIEK
jgi:hypothetical protein